MRLLKPGMVVRSSSPVTVLRLSLVAFELVVEAPEDELLLVEEVGLDEAVAHAARAAASNRLRTICIVVRFILFSIGFIVRSIGFQTKQRVKFV